MPTNIHNHSPTDVLRSDENDHPFTFSVPLGEAETQAILEPIRLACAVDVPRVQEPALGCLHKLVRFLGDDGVLGVV